MKKIKDVSLWWFFILANVMITFVIPELFHIIIPQFLVFDFMVLGENEEILVFIINTVRGISFIIGLDLLLLLLSYYSRKRLFPFPRLQVKFLYLLLKPMLMLTSSFAIGKTILLSFFTFTNRLIMFFPRHSDLNRIPLLLLPRCLQNSECDKRVIADVDACIRCGKCDLAPLIALKDEYEIEVFVAGGGGEAKKKLLEAHPSVVVAVACLDELMLNSVAALKYPLVAFSNDAGDAPCKNTKTDVDVIRDYLDKVAEPRK